MIIDKKAKIYAKALIESGSDYNEILKELLFAEDIIEKSTELKNIIMLPTISIQQKTDIIDAIFRDKISKTLLNFLKILAEKNYLGGFNEIVNAYKAEVAARNNVTDVTVVSAVELNDVQKDKIMNTIKNKIGSNINTFWELDKEIIAGLIVKYDDNVIDTSVKNKLEKLSKNIIKGIK